ncbi:MAG: PfkB family carbohydrate kinase [Puniceicoccales bacterium]|jgi:D-beta-D-heptose 7-phosphate kinase/D-beta-D-heptose 1-phosphate adenosyltransferase|nr:PfkB family carbohydrate kinase [Puniceicoccales bacterium]
MQSILDRASGLRGVVIGDLLLDHYVLGTASRLSPEAPVPILLVEEDTWCLGGAANVASNLKALGVSVEVVGLVGRDPTGDRLQNLFAAHNILFDELFRDPAVHTISKTRIVSGGHQLCRVDRERDPASYALAKNEAFLERAELSLRNADLLIFSDYGKGTLSKAAVDRLTAAARSRNCFVAADPKPSRPLPFHQVDLLTPNAGEACAMADMEPSGPRGGDWAKVCKKIHGLCQSKNLVITLGRDGMLVAVGGQAPHRIATCAKAVCDVTGAGDTVIAALSVALATGHDLETAARFANTAAGIVVGKFGTATATPAEILNFSRGLVPGS